LLEPIKNMTKIKSPLFVPEIKLYCVIPEDFNYPFEPTEFNCMFGYPTWASIALSRYILDNPDKFKGLNITDIGCGSGVATIAAKKVGALVTSIDRDVSALYFTDQNCALNGLTANLIWGSFDQIKTEYVMLSSLFYDEKNVKLIQNLLENKKVMIGSLQPNLPPVFISNLKKILVNNTRNLYLFSNFIS